MTNDSEDRRPSAIQFLRSSFTRSLFAVRTPTATVTDLGTEFGVEVGKSGVTVAHVFRGMVKVQPAADGNGPSRAVFRLTENQSLRIEKPQGDVEAKVYYVTADAAAFVRSEQLCKLVTEKGLEPLRRWQAYSRQLRKDPTLVAYYSFESVGKDSWLLPNVAATGPRSTAKSKGRCGRPAACRASWPWLPRSGHRRQGGIARATTIQLYQTVLAGRVVPGRPVQSRLRFRAIAKGGVTWRLQRWQTTNCLRSISTGDDLSALQVAAPYRGHRSSLASCRRRDRASPRQVTTGVCTWTAAWRGKSRSPITVGT